MNNNTITVSHPDGILKGSIDLASSKSESNRVLIINALAGENSSIQRLANARDTQTMQRLLASDDDVVDVLDAGTTMRFLTAYHAVKGHKVTMTGTARMQERPIGLLVDALRKLGADIEYTKNDGYPPFAIKGFNYSGQNNLEIRGDVSSQYISALLMVSPYLPEGLNITLTEKVASWPYLDMTLRIMEYYGASILHPAKGEKRSLEPGETITVQPGKYKGKNFIVEADWSAASYWYSAVALSKDADLRIYGLKKAEESLQGDSVMAFDPSHKEKKGIMERLGVLTEYDNKGVTRLKKAPHSDNFEHDFTYCPDIAQTVAVICAAKGIKARLSGLESLRIKETDRIEAIKNELTPFGAEIKIIGDEAMEISESDFSFPDQYTIKTYHDHRMAMAFAPLGLMGEVRIEDKTVVNKSYPDFWRDFEHTRFTLKD